MRGGPLIVYGDGSQTRSFCYISDMVTALMRVMSTPDQVTGPINLGNPEEVSVIEVGDFETPWDWRKDPRGGSPRP